MRVHRYPDYEEYRRIQTEGNREKLHEVWADERDIAFLVGYIQKRIERPRFGICHGTRRGLEQKWFAEGLGCKVIGTEISDTATDFPDTIQWDFHEVKPEWIGAVDFIYSNSFDHSYDPKKCLDAWMRCLRPKGFAIIEYAFHSEPTALDPVAAYPQEMAQQIKQWGADKYYVRDYIPLPPRSAGRTPVAFIVVQNF